MSKKVDLKYVADLVDDARLGDSNAFASLFAITYNEQYNLAYSYVWDKAFAQDVIFAVYLNTLQLLDGPMKSRDFIKYLTENNVLTCEALALEKDITPPKGHIHIPPYPLEDAKQMLEYIFYEAHMEQNTIPLEVLIEHNDYVSRRFGFQKFLILIVVIGFILAPSAFITPKFELTQNKSSKHNGTLEFDLTVKNHIPIDTVTATIGGESTPVLQSDRRSFYVLPVRNGQLSVTVKYITRRTTTKTINVSGVDRDVPVLERSETKGDEVLLYVKDEGTGINYGGIFGLDENNQNIPPKNYNGIIGEVVFPYPETKIDVYIPDRAGNILHAVINNGNQAAQQEQQAAEQQTAEQQPAEQPAADPAAAQ